MSWFLHSLSSLPTIKWSTRECPYWHSQLFWVLQCFLLLDKCPNTTLCVVTTAERRGRYWWQRAGAFHGVFQNIYGQLLHCFCEKTLLHTILVTREVLRGSVALKELKRVRESIVLCSGLKVNKFSSTLLKIWSKYISGFSHPPSNEFTIN